MTSKVTVEAQSHPCEVRVLPRVGDRELWQTLSDETRRFAEQVIPCGEAREYSVHSGQSVLVRELVEESPKVETNNHDEQRATPGTAPPGRYLLRDFSYWAKPFEAELLEWSSSGRVKLGAPGTPRWLEGNDIPFVVDHLASVDTLPKGRDAKQGSVGTKGSAVPKADAQNTPPGQSPKGGN